LQYLYGANFDTATGDTTYTVDFDTGEFFIDGAGQGIPNNRETLRTIWDGAGNDTLDLSNAQSALRIDLQPGNFTSFGQAYLAYQGEGRFGNDLYAEGNIANAYLYEGNPASLIENAIGGDFSDYIVGNIAHNMLFGGAGDDSLFGLVGDDDLDGGSGDDLIVDGIGVTTAHGGEGADFIVALSSDNTLDGGLDGDILIGGTGNDLLQGGDGNDVLRGDAGRGLLFGADRLVGGLGDDLMMGGRGADLFEFAVNAGNDVIGNFLASDLEVSGAADVVAQGSDFQSGIDQIVLSGFAGVTKENVGTFISAQADTGHAMFLAEGTSITFFDIAPDALSAEDFLFL
jgi:serralysin